MTQHEIEVESNHERNIQQKFNDLNLSQQIFDPEVGIGVPYRSCRSVASGSYLKAVR